MCRCGLHIRVVGFPNVKLDDDREAANGIWGAIIVGLSGAIGGRTTGAMQLEGQIQFVPDRDAMLTHGGDSYMLLLRRQLPAAALAVESHAVGRIAAHPGYRSW